MSALPLFLRRTATSYSYPFQSSLLVRKFRSDAALEAISKASEAKTPNLVLYNYPSFSGAYGALFAHLYHSRLNLPCLILPFSSVVPFSVKDLCVDGLETCYFLDFFGPKGFAEELSSRTSCKVIGFDHRQSMLSIISLGEDSDINITFHLNPEKSSSTAAYEYFSNKLQDSRHNTNTDEPLSLLNNEDQQRIEVILKYIEDGDLCKWSLPNSKAFNIGLGEWRSKLNCIMNLWMYEQLMQLCSLDLIREGNAYLSHRQAETNKLFLSHKVFRVRLGRGFYGDCLGIRVDGHSDYADELARELSRKSAAAGLRPIGAVIYMKRNKNLKMCLRTTDSITDTSEIAKAYGGGGSRSSSSFTIRMDEYNHWLSMQSSPRC